MYIIPTILGALLACGIVSRILLFLMKNLPDDVIRLAIANGVTAVIGFVLGGFGAANGGPFEPAGGLIYPVVQIVVFGIDLLALKGRRAAKAAAKAEREKG
ncbi:hypothetical protein ABAC460_16205 [Asticcacaulis sp. AC460]|uniref:hypothetical protein n=1 Tax=Asticcacaulis sp. AC460 TaxID=1282360 RepID=UPI0003C3ACE1|nr:hypothetical protein [Asticcacaulis sp. AC460]ESQ88203.1 hypothetical protein ABAC460_16205 [Asticcacaulis sp. AC460]